MARLMETSVELNVAFHDVDMLHIAWHGNYLRYMEHARTALLRRAQIDVSDMKKLGFRFVIIESQVRHTSALLYGDRFRVTAWFGQSEPSDASQPGQNGRLTIHYRFHRIEHTEPVDMPLPKGVARAKTTLVTTDPHGNRYLEIPHEIRTRIGA